MRIRILALITLSAALAHAQTGVSDDRVSLADGPGSLDGIGDNATINPNQGAMSWQLPIDVPAGFGGMTPQLAFSYSSNAGSGPLGIGWSMAVPHIERMTNWGLPEYTADDDFVANGGEQLVRVEAGATATYRARFEGAFVRYRWHGVGDGTGGYWTAEAPDGVVHFFGARADGTIVDEARVAGRGGATFRYLLVESRDPFGHRVEYDYASLDGRPYLDRISYIFTGGAGASAWLDFEYEDRPDPLSDARSGSNERMTQRLAAVRASEVTSFIRGNSAGPGFRGDLLLERKFESALTLR